MELPDIFCWTRFGTEAGETTAQIFARKERERSANGGVFLWGIGNALGPSIRAMLAVERAPQVIFSSIQSSPRPQDVVPEQIVRWRGGKTLDGETVSLPPASVVTSGHRAGKILRKRYALVCKSADPIAQNGIGAQFSMAQLFNFSSGNRVGASQVTAVVGLDSKLPKEGLIYRVALRVALVAPFYVELVQPEIVIPQRKRSKAA